MKIKTCAWLLAISLTAAAAAAQTPQATSPAQPAPPGPPPTVAAPNVRAGIEAWQAGNYPLAIANWRPLADRNDADAQYNIAQAYFLGRGVPQNANLAEQWYARAARQGHEQAQANYGLLLFQNGRRAEAMPWIERAANRGDPRAQYVLGTALYNGDLVTQDLPRAYALMTRAAGTGLPPAVTQLEAMNRLISAEDRARGTELAQALSTLGPPAQTTGAAPARVAQAQPQAPAPAQTAPRTTAPPPGPARVAQAQPPVQSRAIPAPPIRIAPSSSQPPAQPRPQPAATAPAQSLASSGGRWRIQLGAFSSEAAARHAWSGIAGRLGGLQPFVTHAGAVYRLQAGPLANRAAADQACTRARQACFPVAP